jgi:hypothetical protein
MLGKICRSKTPLSDSRIIETDHDGFRIPIGKDGATSAIHIYQILYAEKHIFLSFQR